ncbi:MAG: hydrogenase expression/formation protein HypE [Deltaproteobacteria bacterium]|nr:hydrogenase expression/formation protein HypE [Deltaproteobacteria bacterium]
MAEPVVTRAHGGGGREMRELIRDVFLAGLGDAGDGGSDDAARIEVPACRLAVTTDSFVVQPWRFPGGNLGDLAVCGTVNDLAMVGARPLYLTAGFVLPEGFPLRELKEIVERMAERAREAGVRIVAGDTKVVPFGDPVVNTAGIGALPEAPVISGSAARPGDAVVLTGDVGRHGIAVLSRREGIGFEAEIESDVAPLNGLVAALLASGAEVHVLRDPTRGGVAGALNEIASASSVEIVIDEARVPVAPAVRSACDLLGYDPLEVANEGCALAFVAGRDAQRALEALRAHPRGRRAAVVGEVREGPARVLARTVLGGTRLVDEPAGELLPRIC